MEIRASITLEEEHTVEIGTGIKPQETAC